MGEFENTVVLVTGGTRGIGRACAALFAREGAKVALCGRSVETAAAAAEAIEGDARGYQADVADPAAVDALIKTVLRDLGPISVLVNNAGLTRDGLILRMKDDAWNDVLAANLTGAFYCCRAAARDMLKQRGGRIINIASIIGLRGQAGQANYAASKAGLIGFTKALARELAPRNITVNAVAPGYIKTDMTAGIAGAALEALLKEIPLQRAGTAEDVAYAVRFLAGEGASYITGAVLTVDGGLAM
jgi:3-oxoacyl-[acyl-carrier protein] reductase